MQTEINSSTFLAKLKKEEEEAGPIQAGDKVLARFSDGQLYRAEIVDQDEGSGIFEVFYCDFGNVGSSSEIYHIPENLKKIQGFAIRCCLSCRIENEEKEKAAKEFARSIQTGSQLLLQVLKVKKNHLEVDLVKMSKEDGMISIRDYLVFLGLACFSPVDETTTFPNIYRKAIKNHQLDLNIGEIHKGFVGHVPFVHPGNWVQISVLVSSAVPVDRLPRFTSIFYLTFSSNLLTWF